MSGILTTAAPSALPAGVTGDAGRSALWLRCPRCAVDLARTECPRCAFRLETSAGIVGALPPERAAYFSRFVAEYERIRAAESRGSDGKDFYLELPYKDITGRNSGQWRIRARTYDYLVRNLLKPNLPTSAAILDLGVANCWMSYRLSQAGYQPVAVDLLTNPYVG